MASNRAYYLTDGGHCLISGATGARADYGGKTTLANWWFEQSVKRGWHDVGLFVNPKAHGSVRGTRVRSLKGLAESYQAGKRLFDFPTDAPDRVIRMLRNLPGEKIVVFDEAQQYRDAEQLHWVVNQGGNLDSDSFTALCVTQRAWNLPEELRGNLPVKIWVGPVTPEGERFFEVENMPGVADRVRADMAPYRWAVTDAGEFQHVNEPVPASYA